LKLETGNLKLEGGKLELEGGRLKVETGNGKLEQSGRVSEAKAVRKKKPEEWRKRPALSTAPQNKVTHTSERHSRMLPA
jgi:hypothetical protein